MNFYRTPKKENYNVKRLRATKTMAQSRKSLPQIRERNEKYNTGFSPLLRPETAVQNSNKSGFRHLKTRSSISQQITRKTMNTSSMNNLFKKVSTKSDDFSQALQSLDALSRLSSSPKKFCVDLSLDKKEETLSDYQVNSIYNAKCNVYFIEDLKIQVSLAHLEHFREHCKKYCINNKIMMSEVN